MLYTTNRFHQGVIEAERGIREALSESAGGRIEYYTEFLDVPMFEGEDHLRTVVTYLRDKYEAHPPSVIISAGEGSLQFLLRHRDQLFPRVPIVHAGVDAAFLQSLQPLPPDVDGTAVELDSARTVDLAFHLHPGASRLVVITGASAWDKWWESRVRSEIARFPPRVKVEFLSGLSMPSLLEKCAALGPDAVIFTAGLLEDGNGHALAPAETVRAMASVSKAPIYGTRSTFIGTGAIGGYLPTYFDMGKQAGKSAAAVIDGVPDALHGAPKLSPLALHVDGRQLRRWGIDADALPKDAVLHFREPTLLEAHRNEVLVAAFAFMVMLGLIAVLLVERQRRIAAELADIQRRAELAHVSRLAMAGELTASIAHEINQPLGAILSNADAADFILDAGGDRQDELRAILSDIRRDDLRASDVIQRLRSLLAKHEFQLGPLEINAALGELAVLLNPEARRRGVTLEVRPAQTPATFAGDHVQVQQVLINLVLNAMDAMAEIPEGKRVVTLSALKTPRVVRIEVADQGGGIGLGDTSKIFESFYSTKASGMGLGLSIARTIVNAHGGRIWAENGRDRGAIFHVEFPTIDGQKPAKDTLA